MTSRYELQRSDEGYPFEEIATTDATEGGLASLKDDMEDLKRLGAGPDDRKYRIVFITEEVVA